MKDFEIKFSLKNLFRETQKEVAQVQTMIKSSAMIGGISTYFGSGPEVAVIVGAVGFAIDFILHCVYLEEKK